MEMVSTAKIRRALAAAENAGPYKVAISSMLGALSGYRGEVRAALLQHHEETHRVLFIVVASDSGLAGGFNIQVERDVENEIASLHAMGKDADVITCGHKPTEYFTMRGIEPVLSFTGISSEPTQDEASEISSYLSDAYIKGKVDRVMLYYQHAKNRVEQVFTIEQVLPVKPQQMALPNAPRTHEAVSAVSEHPQAPVFEFDPSPADVLGYLMPAYINTLIFHALLDSAAAEHGARRRAMQAATDNASDIITTLNRSYNRIRQSSITTELNEIVGGASALEDN
jgi:F-type H+-transporting ATPase subunit gamma